MEYTIKFSSVKIGSQRLDVYQQLIEVNNHIHICKQRKEIQNGKYKNR